MKSTWTGRFFTKEAHLLMNPKPKCGRVGQKGGQELSLLPYPPPRPLRRYVGPIASLLRSRLTNGEPPLAFAALPPSIAAAPSCGWRKPGRARTTILQ